MESKITNPDIPDVNQDDSEILNAPSSTYKISPHPIVATAGAIASGEPSASPLPRSYGTESLTLLARDPQTIFAFWDIDWETAFRHLEPKTERKVHLRLLDASGAERSLTEVESMAGSCFIGVPRMAATYRGEIGYYDVRERWNCVAKSAVVMTAAEVSDERAEADFATVPFHLSFQRMVDMLEETKRENQTLTAMLSDLRERISVPETSAGLTTEQCELGKLMQKQPEKPEQAGALRAPDPQRARKLERILRSESSSPQQGFGGSSRTR